MQTQGVDPAAVQQSLASIPAELQRRLQNANRLLASPNASLPEKLDMISKQLKTLPDTDPDSEVNPLMAMQQQQAQAQPSQQTPVKLAGRSLALLVGLRVAQRVQAKTAARGVKIPWAKPKEVVPRPKPVAPRPAAPVAALVDLALLLARVARAIRLQ